MEKPFYPKLFQKYGQDVASHAQKPSVHAMEQSKTDGGCQRHQRRNQDEGPKIFIRSARKNCNSWTYYIAVVVFLPLTEMARDKHYLEGLVKTFQGDQTFGETEQLIDEVRT